MVAFDMIKSSIRFLGGDTFCNTFKNFYVLILQNKEIRFEVRSSLLQMSELIHWH